VQNASVSAGASNSYVGPLVGYNYGSVINGAASGSVSNPGFISAGGLVGYDDGGGIALSRSAATVSSGQAGGLVGSLVDGGAISESFSTGKAISAESAGGLVGTIDGGSITNCYSTGTARVPKSRNAVVGGFAGGSYAEDKIGESYSTGDVKGGATGREWTRGGFIGYTLDTSFVDSYWNTETSGFKDLHKGAGNVKNQSGISGLTTEQMRSGLPTGFDPSIWGENKKINDGFPFLLANPPR
jgi:hypothetical protein